MGQEGVVPRYEYVCCTENIQSEKATFINLNDCFQCADML